MSAALWTQLRRELDPALKPKQVPKKLLFSLFSLHSNVGLFIFCFLYFHGRFKRCPHAFTANNLVRSYVKKINLHFRRLFQHFHCRKFPPTVRSCACVCALSHVTVMKRARAHIHDTHTHREKVRPADIRTSCQSTHARTRFARAHLHV